MVKHIFPSQITNTIFVYVGLYIYMGVCVKHQGFLTENILQLKHFMDLGRPNTGLGWL